MEFVSLILLVTFLPLFQSLEIPGNRYGEDTIAWLTKRMDALEARNAALTDENKDMKAIIRDQQKEIDRLAAVSEEQTTSNQRLEERLAKLEKDITPDETNHQHQNAPVMNRIKKADNERVIAFFAVMQNNLENPGTHQQVLFERVVSNMGQAFNPHAGDFRAPVSGVYVFSTTLRAGITTSQYAFQIMRNGNGVSNLHIQAGGTASQEVVLYLNAGDDVAVHNLYAGHQVYGHSYSTFSGFLLQEDFTVTAPSIVGK